MNREWKLLACLSLWLILITPLVLAADVNLGGWPPSNISRNIPAGTEVDPGSQLLYIVDTGINISAAVENEQITEADAATRNVHDLLGITGAHGEIQTNFISITNTHPAKAVTIHFRYFNDACESVLDFLLILSCNDTLLFNPFDFEIPAASLAGNPINTKSRIFGPDVSGAFTAIKADKFASGRFLISATAVAAVRIDTEEEQTVPGSLPGPFFDNSSGPGYNFETQLADQPNDYMAWDTPANILFPFELGVALDQECNIDARGVTFRAEKDGIHDPETNPTRYRNVGSERGVSQNNLHVFNASAVNFNYLIGHKATAVPKGFIQGVRSDQDRYLGFGLNAWARPAIHGGLGSLNALIGYPNGDGPPLDQGNFAGFDVPEYVLLMGSEILMRRSDTTTFLTAASGSPNLYYLRQDAHGGDTVRAVATEGVRPSTNGPRVHSSGAALDLGGPRQSDWARNTSPRTFIDERRAASTDDIGDFSGVGVGGSSWYGALAWTSLHTSDPHNQIMHPLSVVDDYDGSKNTDAVVTVGGEEIFDHSYNLAGGQTRYILQIYDNMGGKEDIVGPSPIETIPPILIFKDNLRIIVDCLRVWIKGAKHPQTRRFGLTVQELYGLAEEVREGHEGFKGLEAVVNPLRDASQGWVRLVRDNNQTRSRTFAFTPAGGGITTTRTVTVTGGTIAPIDHEIMDNLAHPTFVTIAEINTRFEGFGAAWWAPAAAYDPAVSNAHPINPTP